MITLIETKDCKLIAPLNKVVQNLHATLHPELFKPLNEKEIETALKDFFKDPSCKCIVALKENESVGYILFFMKETKESAFQYATRTLYIDQLSVLTEHQNSGVGKLLLDEVEKIARQNAITRIVLDHWSSNTKAAKYFRRKGFNLNKERLYKLM
jgi:diamine N-acetyltransferase